MKRSGYWARNCAIVLLVLIGKDWLMPRTRRDGAFSRTPMTSYRKMLPRRRSRIFLVTSVLLERVTKPSAQALPDDDKVLAFRNS